MRWLSPHVWLIHLSVNDEHGKVATDIFSWNMIQNDGNFKITKKNSGICVKTDSFAYGELPDGLKNTISYTIELPDS